MPFLLKTDSNFFFAFPFDDPRYDGYAKIVGEFGVHGWPVPGHLGDQKKRNLGYGGFPKTKQEYIERYRESINRLAVLKRRGVAGCVYTHATDVVDEINGLMTGMLHLGVDDKTCWPLQRGFERYSGCISGAIDCLKPGSDRGITEGNQAVDVRDDFYATDAFTDKAIGYIDESAAKRLVASSTANFTGLLFSLI